MMKDLADGHGINVHIYPGSLEYASRILKVTHTLVREGIVDRVLVVGTAKEGLPAWDAIDEQRYVLRVPARVRGLGLIAKTLRFIEWSARVWWRLRAYPVTMVNCHTLSVLPLCVVLKWFHRATLVYEPHELETETFTSKGLRRRLAKWAEGLLVGQASKVIVVSDRIAAHYRADYGLRDVPVILNVPELDPDSIGEERNRLYRDRFQIPDDHLIFTYQGVLDEARGTHLLLEVFHNTSPDRHLVLMGFGPMEERIRAAVARSPNIHFHPPVRPAEVMRYTKAADVGFALLTKDCLNHQATLPNKIFTYLHAGVPVIATDTDSMVDVISKYRCGWAVDYDVDSIAKAVSRVDHAGLRACLAGAARAKHDLNWSREVVKLVAIYRRPELIRASRADGLLSTSRS